ncbi:hypothetical protein [Actinophytocola sp.]|uniref:hypothetical protein n=1 Tax=Actinophytocola sp. TaxID=1872138 RepID=UPI002D7EC2B7|nr:hypothetical protein [Actinophytocola sp.]HET9139806.1 hypothetical protein [Actinophytocola sp.]
MDEVREQRWGAVSGFAALVLGGVAVGFERSVPDPDRTPAEVLDFYLRNGSELLAQSLLFVLSSGLFLWFLGGLRTFLARIEGRPARMASIAYAAGIAWIVLNLAVQAPQIALARAADTGLQPQLAVVVNDIGLALATIADVPVAVLVTAVAVLSLRDKVLPTWLGWLSALVAVAHLAGWAGIVTAGGPLSPGGWATFVIYPVFVVWLIGITTVMFTHAREPVRQGGVS